MQRLRFGIVGVGNRGRALGRAALATGQADVVAFADPYEPSLSLAAGTFPDATSFTDLEALLKRGGLDAVLVATPNHQHTDIVLAALQAGVHVLCEKPLALTLDDCERMAAEAKAQGRILQVGMELRHARLFVEMHRLIATGAIGAPKLLWCHEFRPPFKPGVGTWRLQQATSGGTLLEKNCHHFDLFNWLSGARPVRVLAMGARDTVYVDRDILDRAWVAVEYDSNVQAALGVAMFFDREEQLELGVLGTDGRVVASLPEGRLALDTPAGRELRSVAVADVGVDGFTHGGEVEQQLAFVNAIRMGQPAWPDAADALWSHAISLAAELAVESGRPIRIDGRGRFGID